MKRQRTYCLAGYKMKIEIPEKMYDKDTVFEALYNLSDLAYFFVEGINGENFVIDAEKKKDVGDDEIINKIKDELLNVKVFNINKQKNQLAEEIILQGCLNELKKC